MQSPGVPTLLRGFIIIVALIGAALYAVRWVEREHPQDLPWTPLDLGAPVGMATKFKLARLAGDKPACLALFDASPLAVTAIADRRAGEQCGYFDAVALERMTAAYAPGSVRLACPLAASLAIWEQQVLQPAAVRHFGSPVARIEHYGTYSCRRLYGRETGRWSRHATAEAIDISGFRLADGKAIGVRGWGESAAAGRFLADIRDGGCRVFGTLLGPDYNAAHADHFHVEAAGFGVCR